MFVTNDTVRTPLMEAFLYASWNSAYEVATQQCTSNALVSVLDGGCRVVHLHLSRHGDNVVVVPYPTDKDNKKNNEKNQKPLTLVQALTLLVQTGFHQSHAAAPALQSTYFTYPLLVLFTLDDDTNDNQKWILLALRNALGMSLVKDMRFTDCDGYPIPIDPKETSVCDMHQNIVVLLDADNIRDPDTVDLATIANLVLGTGKALFYPSFASVENNAMVPVSCPSSFVAVRPSADEDQPFVRFPDAKAITAKHAVQCPFYPLYRDTTAIKNLHTMIHTLGDPMPPLVTVTNQYVPSRSSGLF
jgi:hypothetical protein